ncbi:hypothetical protein MMC27_007267 [Xylographa pallens]|nr:hypothetical protein [Xylographa pallens]
MPSIRSSKKQTRLAFTPLPSSSPQSASLPSHLQTRAASVRYDDSASPTKRRRVLDIAATPKITTVSSPSKLVASTQVSDAVSEEDSVMQSPFKRPWSSKKTSPSKRINRGLPTPDPSSQLQLEEPDSYSESISSDTDSNILPKARLAQPSTPRSKLRKVRKIQFRARTNSITEDEETSLRPKHATRSQARKATVLSSNEDTEESVTPSSLHQRRQRSRGAGESPPIAGQSRYPLSSRVNPRSLLFGGYSGSAPPISLRRRIDLTPTRLRNRESVFRSNRSASDENQTRRRSFKTRSARMHRKAGLSDSDSTLPDVATLLTPRAAGKQTLKIISDDESDVVVAPRRNGRANEPRPNVVSFDQETEESEDVVATPTKRKRLTRHTKQSGRMNTPRKQDDEDLEEDLEVLQGTELRTERTRGKAPPSKRNAALEVLKARRVGQKVIDLSSESEVSTGPKRALYDHDSVSEAELQEDTDQDKDEDEDWRNEAIRQSLRDEGGEYDEDFVVDDEEETLGAPGVLEDIPLEFTRHAHKKTKEHFKDIVEWMVHKKLNPAFPRDDDVYRVAFYKLDDEVTGYAGSKFLSSVWTADFARAIKARPRYSDVPVPVEMFRDLHHCEACNRRNHPAKFIITFAGKAYHKETLENVSEDDEERNDSDDDDAGSRNAEGFVLPSVDRQYYVGRYCKENAEIAHSLLHWRYHLNDWILDWLENEGYETPVKIVERDKWSIKKRSDYANTVVDDMEKKGEIKALHRDFKINLDTARNYKVGFSAAGILGSSADSRL